MSGPLEFAPARRRDPWTHPATRALGWVACIAAMYALVVASGDALRDPDSTLYAAIAHQLAHRPFVDWIAPLFPPHRFKSGLFFEHPAAFFWPAALLDHLGFSRGAELANFGYALALLAVLFRLAERMADKATAWVALGAYLISPLGVQYLLRANQENAWALGFLGAILCAIELPRNRWAGPLMVLCAVWAFWMKGVLALTLFPVAWLISRTVRALRIGPWLAISAVAIAAASLVYEWAYRHVTGEPFLSTYVHIQLGYVGAFEHRVLSTFAGPVYYGLNALWFALPGSLLAISACTRWIRTHEAPLATRAGTTGALALVLLLSLMSRHAVRYIFPAYALVQLAGAPELVRFPKVRTWITARDARLPYMTMAALVVILAMRIAVDRHAYHFVDLLGGLP